MQLGSLNGVAGWLALAGAAGQLLAGGVMAASQLCINH